MNDHIYEVQSYTHTHDRYGVHGVVLKPRSMIDTPILVPTTHAIDPDHRIMFPSIGSGDVVHCQGGGDHMRAIVYKEPSATDRIACSCGENYIATPTRVYCPNSCCSRTEFGRLCYFVASVFQNTLSKQALRSIYMDLACANIRSINQFLSKYNASSERPIIDNLMRSCNLMTSSIRDRRDLHNSDQNAFILSLIDALGLPGLQLNDIITIFSNESIDFQNGEGGSSAEYYYNALSSPEYLHQITGIPLSQTRSISREVEVRELGSTISLIGDFGFSREWSNDNDLFS